MMWLMSAQNIKNAMPNNLNMSSINKYQYWHLTPVNLFVLTIMAENFSICKKSPQPVENQCLHKSVR